MNFIVVHLVLRKVYEAAVYVKAKEEHFFLSVGAGSWISYFKGELFKLRLSSKQQDVESPPCSENFA